MRYLTLDIRTTSSSTTCAALGVLTHVDLLDDEHYRYQPLTLGGSEVGPRLHDPGYQVSASQHYTVSKPPMPTTRPSAHHLRDRLQVSVCSFIRFERFASWEASSQPWLSSQRGKVIPVDHVLVGTPSRDSDLLSFATY